MIDPRGMTLRDWADSVILATSDVWSVGKLTDEARWADWASNLVRAFPVSQQAAPDPYQFDSWSEWAMRAYPMLEVVN